MLIVLQDACYMIDITWLFCVTRPSSPALAHAVEDGVRAFGDKPLQKGQTVWCSIGNHVSSVSKCTVWRDRLRDNTTVALLGAWI